MVLPPFAVFADGGFVFWSPKNTLYRQKYTAHLFFGDKKKAYSYNNDSSEGNRELLEVNKNEKRNFKEAL